MSNDTWQAMNEAQEPSKFYFGENTFDPWFCVLQKGVGKVPFDPDQHKAGQRRTAIEITIVPLNGDFTIERAAIAESREWAGIILPSIKALGLEVQGLHEKYVKVEMVASRKYTDKNGEERVATVPKYLAVYPNREACEAASKEMWGESTGGGNDDDSAEPFPAGPIVSHPPSNGGNGLPPEVQINFAKALVNTASNMGEVSAKLAGANLGAMLNNPEVVQYMLEKWPNG